MVREPTYRPEVRDVGRDFEALLEWTLRTAADGEIMYAEALMKVARDIYRATRFCPEYHGGVADVGPLCDVFDEVALDAQFAAYHQRLERAAELGQRLLALFAEPACPVCGALPWVATSMSVPRSLDH